MNAYNAVTPAIAQQLAAIVGAANVIYAEPERMQDYAHDETVGTPTVRMPEAVVKPAGAGQISAIMRLANQERIPVTPRGAGSGLSGGAVPLAGGILLSVERMNHILEIDDQNMVAVVEPGVITNDVNEAVREHGMFYAGYPMSTETCFVGGNVAENAGGGRAIKYGVTERYVLGLEVVLPTGEIVEMGGKRLKDVTGYNMLHLMVGSEGTLGIFTRIILRLMPLPGARAALLVPFRDAQAAIDLVPKIMTRAHVVPAAIEFMDRASLEVGYEFAQDRMPRRDLGAMLLIEVDGSTIEQVEADYSAVVDLCLESGALDIYVGNTPADVRKMWLPRQKMAEGLTIKYPVQSAEDIVVPPATIPALLAQMADFDRDHGTMTIAYGHAGDGNLHLRLVKAPGVSLELWHAGEQMLHEDLYHLVRELGGTISAEHGIGVKLKQYLPVALAPEMIALQRRIKDAFDPLGILNPGKIFP